MIEELKTSEIVIIEENLPEEVDSQSESQPQSEELTTNGKSPGVGEELIMMEDLEKLIHLPNGEYMEIA